MSKFLDVASKFLDGKKTHAAGLALVLLGIGQIYVGEATAGAASIATGLGLVFQRRAIAKITPPSN